MKDFNQEVIILGGGLAGLTAGIHLSKKGLKVLLIEKNEYPLHKVCGEFISMEILPYLNWLDIDPYSLNAVSITRAEFSLTSGEKITTVLPLGGFGISRYALDEYLMKTAKRNGVEILQDQVISMSFSNDLFSVQTKDKGNFRSKIVLGAFGKRSNLDIRMERSFIKKKSPWLAVKAHYSGSFPDDLVGLHNFKGGYCGISKVENNAINICYLTNFKSFKKHKSISEFQENVLSQNPNLKNLFNQFKISFDQPISISQISFDQKEKQLDHVLMIGDAAGLIHPLCGNGMAMAIHSAKIVSELVLKYFSSTNKSRRMLEEEYQKEWSKHFQNRLRIGKWISNLLRNNISAKLLFICLLKSPFLLRKVIQKTHGKTIPINDQYEGEIQSD